MARSFAITENCCENAFIGRHLHHHFSG